MGKAWSLIITIKVTIWCWKRNLQKLINKISKLIIIRGRKSRYESRYKRINFTLSNYLIKWLVKLKLNKQTRN